MTALKAQPANQSENHPHLKVIKGEGKPFFKKANRARYFFNKRNKYRKEKERKKKEESTPHKNIFFANACVETLKLMQRVALFLNPAFHFERKVPHYHTLHKSICTSKDAENYSIHLIEKELIIYKSFSGIHPQRLEDYAGALKLGENEYAALVQQREESYLDKESGLRMVAKKLLLYVCFPDMELFFEINEGLVGYKDLSLVQLFHTMSFHVNFLDQK